MAPEWRYSQEDNGLFVVYANGTEGSTRRRFRAADGVFVDEKPGRGRSYAHFFKADFKSGARLGELRGRPNLEDAVRAGRLPSDVLGELKSLTRSIAGITV